MQNVKSILLIRLKAIGDVLLTLPAVAVIRENFPSAKITFLTSQENVSLLRGFREVNEVIALDRAALRSGNPRRVASELFHLLRQLRAGKFTLAVDFQGFGETAWLTRLAGAPQRWGCVYSSGRQWAYTHSTHRDSIRHVVETHFNLLRTGGLKLGEVKNDFLLPADALTAAKKFFNDNFLDSGQPTLFLQPFTSSSPKDWPLENFYTLARYWKSQGWQIIFGGGPADRAKLQRALDAGYAVSAGVPLLVTGGLMKLSTLVVGGDTGALHLAVALKKRVVMLMVAAGQTYPMQHRDWVIASPENSIQDIEVDTVITACTAAVPGFQ